MDARPLSEYFNCGHSELGRALYNGMLLGFYAVADHMNTGYAFARTLPIEQARGPPLVTLPLP